MMRNLFGSDQKKQESFFGKALNVLEPMYRFFSVDFPIMKLIVETKMTMDSRQENPIANTWNNKKRDEDKNPFFQSLWVYALISMLLLFLFSIDNILFQYTAFFSYVFIMLFSTLIANFSSILLNTKDQVLIGTKPVSSRTLSAAKATHVFIYLISFTVAIAGPMIAASFFFHGFMIGLMAIILTIVAAVWCLLLTIITYATVLKRFNGERLKNIIAYSQIGISVFTIVGYQIMNQVIQVVDPSTLAIELNLQWWHAIVFPLWFVAPFGILQQGWSVTYGVYVALLVIGTISIVLLYRLNNDKIELNLQKMESGEADEDKRSWYETATGNLVCWNAQEKGYYHFVWQLTKHEREFKTRLYPSLASILVFPFVFMISSLRLAEAGLESSGLLIYMPYFTMMIIPMLSTTLRYSKNYKGRWVFGISSNADAHFFFQGVIKAMTMKLIFPLYMLLSIIVLVIAGWELAVPLLNGFFLIIILFCIEVRRTLKTYPFSKQYDASEANQGCMATMIFFAIIMIAAIVMYLVQTFIPFGSIVALVILVTAAGWFLTKGFKSVILTQQY